jgi:hypothetical protein
MALGGHHEPMTTMPPIVLIDATATARRTVRGAGADGFVPERPRRRRRKREA